MKLLLQIGQYFVLKHNANRTAINKTRTEYMCMKKKYFIYNYT